MKDKELPELLTDVVIKEFANHLDEVAEALIDFEPSADGFPIFQRGFALGYMIAIESVAKSKEERKA